MTIRDRVIGVFSWLLELVAGTHAERAMVLANRDLKA
jgi:hypothetical protein